jgi:hypothetical protein
MVDSPRVLNFSAVLRRPLATDVLNRTDGKGSRKNHTNVLYLLLDPTRWKESRRESFLGSRIQHHRRKAESHSHEAGEISFGFVGQSVSNLLLFAWRGICRGLLGNITIQGGRV